MVTPIVLLYIPTTLRSWALLTHLPNGFQARLLLFLAFLLVLFLLPAHSIVVFCTRLAFVPCVVMDNTDAEPTFLASPNVVFVAPFVHVAGLTAWTSTPSEVGIGTKGVAQKKVSESALMLAGPLYRFVLARDKWQGRLHPFAHWPKPLTGFLGI